MMHRNMGSRVLADSAGANPITGICASGSGLAPRQAALPFASSVSLRLSKIVSHETD